MKLYPTEDDFNILGYNVAVSETTNHVADM